MNKLARSTFNLDVKINSPVLKKVAELSTLEEIISLYTY